MSFNPFYSLRTANLATRLINAAFWLTGLSAVTAETDTHRDYSTGGDYLWHSEDDGSHIKQVGITVFYLFITVALAYIFCPNCVQRTNPDPAPLREISVIPDGPPLAPRM